MTRRPRIIIITQVYPPEIQATAVMVRELAWYLKDHQWEVQVVAGFPHHPHGKLYPGYKMRPWQKELEDGIPVLRVGHLVSESRSIPIRASVFLTQAIGNMLGGLAAKKADLVLVYGPPVAGPPLAWLVAKWHRAKLVNVIYDVYPDIAIETGKVKNPAVIAAARLAEKFQYLVADCTLVLSEGLKRLLVNKGVPPDKIAVIPVWLDPDEIKPMPRDNSWRRENKIPLDKTVVLYAGTIGIISGAEMVADAAALLRDRKDILFVFVGAGEARAPLESKAKELRLDNIMFFPYQERSRLPEVQATGDIGLVTLLPGRGRTSVPSKVLGYMAAGRPVVASVDFDSDTGTQINRDGIGVLCNPADPNALANAIIELVDSPELREEMGKSARAAFLRDYSRDSVLASYEMMLKSVIFQ